MTIDELQRAMQDAATALDFDAAARLRDRLSIARATGTDPGDDAATLLRQQPGAMGIGSSQPRPARPDGWVKPAKPPSLTANTGRSGRGKGLR